MNALPLYRRFYAEELRAVADLESEELVQAFATVPREAFLGTGPWQIFSGMPGLGTTKYRHTPDANPEHVYHNVAIAIDAARRLNNGQPSALAPAIEALDLKLGDRAAHIGAGTGYYSAVLAELVGPSGRLLAIEVDSGLAGERAATSPAVPGWRRSRETEATSLDRSMASSSTPVRLTRGRYGSTPSPPTGGWCYR